MFYFYVTLYVPSTSCVLNIALISLTFGLGIIYCVLSVSNWRVEHTGLFTSSMVFALSTFYAWGAINRYE